MTTQRVSVGEYTLAFVTSTLFALGVATGATISQINWYMPEGVEWLYLIGEFALRFAIAFFVWKLVSFLILKLFRKTIAPEAKQKMNLSK
ncbi:hypothetical protein FLK61_38455 [Paenalkalicoccus suaedae]|uniref:Uncharacterized protein n=1 Tax=Paenalkalicoccus suaedae TaxID=2592382 RepID=A0A859FH97_9BACI|nr:hypothetical protein [Paenalkalicoccus suaedae]QKS72507.1 hypothetical protein FLK61_38455 [Paenalkalicoccus suaedae]